MGNKTEEGAQKESLKNEAREGTTKKGATCGIHRSSEKKEPYKMPKKQGAKFSSQRGNDARLNRKRV